MWMTSICTFQQVNSVLFFFQPAFASLKSQPKIEVMFAYINECTNWTDVNRFMFLKINSFNERKNALDKNGEHNKCVNWKWIASLFLISFPFFLLTQLKCYVLDPTIQFYAILSYSNFVISIKNLHCLFYSLTNHSRSRATYCCTLFLGRYYRLWIDSRKKNYLATHASNLFSLFGIVPCVHLLCFNGLSRCYPIWYRSCGCFYWYCSRFCCYVFSIYSLNSVESLKKKNKHQTPVCIVHSAYRYFAIQSACS